MARTQYIPNHDSHVRLWRLWNEFNFRQDARVLAFHWWRMHVA